MSGCQVLVCPNKDMKSRVGWDAGKRKTITRTSSAVAISSEQKALLSHHNVRKTHY